MFFRGSRYEPIANATMTTSDGSTITYKRMRFVPAEKVVARSAVKVVDGERPDLLAYRSLGDAEQFWRLCDLNLVQRPVDLTAATGRAVVVPGPEGGG